MKINIPYENTNLEFEVPDKNIWQVIYPAFQQPVSDINRELIKSFRKPIGISSLRDIIEFKEPQPKDMKVVLICDDLNYQTPQKQILDMLIPHLQEAGIAQSNICIVIANGLARPMTTGETHKRFGSWMAPILVECHDPDNETQLVDIGKSPFGGRIEINRKVVEADLKICISSVQPDSLMGLTGGTMLLFPGVASRKTIKAYYSKFASINYPLKSITDSNSRIVSNKAAMMIGLDFAINIVVNSADSVCGIFSGHYMIAHSKASDFAWQTMKTRMRPGADLLIVGSHPGNKDLFQGGKIFLNLSHTLRDRGKAILLTPCQLGMSNLHPGFENYLQMPADKLISSIKNQSVKDPLSGTLAYWMANEFKRLDVSLVCSDKKTDLKQVPGTKSFNHVSNPLENYQKIMGDSLRICIAPYGGKVIPYYSDEEGKNPYTTKWI
ncbi:MAG: lactate racemase domain-containing protein [Vulcanimicrobiota bacterium]